MYYERQLIAYWYMRLQIAAEDCDCDKKIEELKADLFRSEFCLSEQLRYCNEHHVDVAFLSQKLTTVGAEYNVEE